MNETMSRRRATNGARNIRAHGRLHKGHSSPSVSKTTVLVMIPERVPEPQGHADIIHHVPRTL